jgi:hypothetical protein
MQQNLMVTKRDGHRELIDLEKIHRVLIWAAEGLDNVSPSEIELKAHIQFYEGIKTSDIHETLIKSAADLISEEAPDYQYLAALNAATLPAFNVLGLVGYFAGSLAAYLSPVLPPVVGVVVAFAVYGVLIKIGVGSREAITAQA